MAEQSEVEQPQEEEFASVDDLALESGEEESPQTPEEPEQEETEEQKEERRKLAGKFESPEELEKAYQELEKEKSRLGNEVGTLRREIDNYIVPELQARKQDSSSSQQAEAPSEEDFWENPQKSIDDRVEQRVKPIEEQLTQRQAQEARERFYEQHPDADNVIQSQDFAQWLEQNPKTKQMLLEADEKYDADTGSEILSLYKQIRGNSGNKSEEPTHDKESLKSASVESSRSEKADSKKVYRRTDILRLQREDPDRYRELYPEILKAYQENRVK